MIFLLQQDLGRDNAYQEFQQAQDLAEKAAQSDHNGDKLYTDSNNFKNQSQSGKVRYEMQSRSEYTMKLLADQGILPNYAFPEEGITLSGSASIKTRSTDAKKRYRWQKISTSRPANPGLRELAPGNSFYIDGLKIPITRIEVAAKGEPQLKLICDSCGTVSPVSQSYKKNEADCPVCQAAGQAIRPIIDVREVYGGGHFADLQLRDQEEERAIRENKSHRGPCFKQGQSRGTTVTARSP